MEEPRPLSQDPLSVAFSRLGKAYPRDQLVLFYRGNVLRNLSSTCLSMWASSILSIDGSAELLDLINNHSILNLSFFLTYFIEA